MTNMSSYEKEMVKEYLKKFGNSPLSRKMLMAAYFAHTYGDGYVELSYYLSVCLNTEVGGADSSLKKTWNITPHKERFFGVKVSTLLNKSFGSLETEIIDLIHNKYSY